MSTPTPPKRPKRPRDFNQLAHQVFLESIGELPKTDTAEPVSRRPSPVMAAVAVPPELIATDPAEPPPDGKNPHAVALSKLGASKGGKARTSAMTPEERKELAKKAAKARWSQTKQGEQK